jgi:hypothetical protein
MNSLLLNLMIIYSIASLLYIVYIVYLKIFKKDKNITNLLSNNTELLDEYTKIKKQHSTVFIICIIISLIILIFSEPNKLIVTSSSIINDINDIKVV